VTDPSRSRPRIRAALFDFDRTLLDLFTPAALARLHGEVVRRYERTVGRCPGDGPARLLVEQARSDPTPRPYALWSGVYQALAAEDHDRAAGLSREVAAILSEHECAAAAARQAPEPLPGVEAALDWLERAGVALAVVSSTCQPAVRTALHRAGVLTRFDVVVARTPELDMDNLAPNPFPIELALEMLPCGPEDAVFVADGVLEMRAGQAAKVHTVGVPRPPATGAELAAAGAAAVLDSMTGLRGLLGEYVGA
jgi:phosphoglycolate phosphatase-like HAD superfamily hydrolase